MIQNIPISAIQRALQVAIDTHNAPGYESAETKAWREALAATKEGAFLNVDHTGYAYDKSGSLVKWADIKPGF